MLELCPFKGYSLEKKKKKELSILELKLLSFSFIGELVKKFLPHHTVLCFDFSFFLLPVI